VTRYLLDTGPLVAYLNRRDEHHAWAVETLERLPSPVVTCEAVLSEACFLTRRLPGGPEAVLALVARGALGVDLRLASEIDPIRRLMRKYADVPMSLADACLVRMAELERDSVVLTTDRDFTVYRRNRRQVIPLLAPPGLR
jgi:predicted nucleic acid-binding protein